MTTCPSCREDDPRIIEPGCLDGDGEPLTFTVCGLCDYGINDHTEGLCHCPKVQP